ncbi:hypothetical protein C0Q70_09995 [Pomacea canaliculata]|uniref:B box-type domain-containing protein n=1 Tax=Pomacea canaliculata TaxID=400727 RepID=A0A2T7PBC5_POMCA|nr:hypothetical protein C0Q70_09995 [Pomacea canaliculata]
MEDQGEKIKDDFLTCPLCLELYTEPKNLKNNFLVIGLLQCFNSQSGPKGRCFGLPSKGPGESCPACEERRECNSYCDECQMWLCGTCVRSHTKLPSTKSHHLLSLNEIKDHSLDRLQQVDEVLQKLFEETDAHLSDITLKRQNLAEQGALASVTVNASGRELRNIIEEKCSKITSEICCQVSYVDDKIHKIQSEMELRKGQLENARKMVSEARSSQLECMHLVPEIEQLMRSLIPLSEVSSEIKSATALQFRQSLIVASMLKSEALGYLEKVQHCGVQDIQEIFPDQALAAQLLSHTDMGFVSSIALTDSSIFVAAGCGHLQILSKNPCKSQADTVPKPYRMWKKPWGIATTPFQTVLVTDAGANPGDGFVAVLKNNGHFMHCIANGMSLPRGVAMHADNVYVCDQEDRCVYVFDYKQSRLIKVLKKDAVGNFHFISPLHIAVTPSGNVIVSDAGRFVKIFSSDFQLKGCYSSSFCDSELWGVCSTGVEENIYVADWKHGVHVLSSNGNFKGILKTPADTSKIMEPTALAYCTTTERLYVGTSSTQVYVLTPV